MSRHPFVRRARRTLALSVIATVAASGLVAVAAPPASAADALAVGGLTTNGRVDPLGIPGADPAFSWQLASPTRGTKQAAYEIEVGRTPGANDVWDTGRVPSTDQLDITYGGPDLTSASQYFWRVQAWDAVGASSGWSSPATFETGLLSAADWSGADWIGKATPSYAAWTNYTAELDFQLRSGAFGTYLRASDINNAYMWQVNVSSGTPMLVPHIKVNGNYTVLPGVNLSTSGFTAAGLLSGTHTIAFALDGNVIRTTLDGKLVDTRTVTNFSRGQIGVRTYGGESVTASRIRVTAKDGTVLAAPSLSVPGALSTGEYSATGVTVSGNADALLNGVESYEPLLRTEFNAAAGKTVRSARVYASARGVYELSLNGDRVGDQYLAPGYTEYEKRIQSQSYDVTDLIDSGTNAFGAELGDGWWAGKVGLAGKYQYGPDLSLIAKLKIEYTDGSVQWVNSNGDWSWAPGPFITTDNQLGETYDANFAQNGWNTAAYDGASWTPITVRPSATEKLSPQPDEPVRATQVLNTVAVTTPAAGRTVYDVGQNMVGIPRVTITGTKGETIKIRHAEVLNPDGTLYTANLRAALATDYYTFAASGTVTYEPTFTQHGFRYIEISGLAAVPTAANVKGVVLGSDVTRTGTLSSSNAMLNQLESNVAWGARGNFLSIPTDTPARDERLGWTGDINVFSPTASYMFDMRGFLGKWMTDVRDEQKPSGSIPSVIPSTNGAFDETGVHWEDAVITVPHALWNAYGNRQVIEQNWDAMAKFFAYARTSAGTDNLEPGRATWFSGDWLHLDDPSDQGVLGTAAWAQDVRMMADMAEAVGKDTLATEYRALYQDVRRAFTSAYVAADGTVKGNSQTGYALALGMDLIPDPALKQRAGEKFVAKLALTDNHLRTGFVGTPWLLPALTAIDRSDIAYSLLLKEDYPSWGYEISKGATTVWERWNSIQPDGSFGPVDMNSFNHYAYGAVADWMHQNIGGIRIGTAGYRTSVVAPNPGGGITSGNGAIDTVYGPLTSKWSTADGDFSLAVTVPVSTTSEIRIPSTDSWSVTEGGNPVRGAAGVTGVSYDAAAKETVIQVGSGTYSFAATDDIAWIAAVPAAAESFSALVETTDGAPQALRDAARTLVTDSSKALELVLADDKAGALAALARVTSGAKTATTTVDASTLPAAKKTELRASLTSLQTATDRATARLRGIDVSLAPVASAQPGSTVTANVTVRNTGTSRIDSTVTRVSITGITDRPVTVTAPAIEAGSERVIPVPLVIGSGARAGSYDARVEVDSIIGSTTLTTSVDAPGWLTVAKNVRITTGSVETPSAGVAWVTATIHNDGAALLTGRIEITPPAGWRPIAPSAFQSIPATESRTVRVAVYPAATAASGTTAVALRFVDRSSTLAQANATIPIAALTAPPAEPTVDYVDFGATASETAHAVRGSATSGTSSEAGFTRRYANNSTPGAWYSADVAVPANAPFLLRMRETWNSPGTKDYEILVDGKLAAHVRLVRTDGGQGVTTHQILVDDPALLVADGTATIQFRYPDTNTPQQYYDPSIADLWVVGRADVTAPAVSAAPTDAALQGDGGWYRSAVDVALTAADDLAGPLALQYDRGAGWSTYSAPVRFATDGTHTIGSRATDRAGLVGTGAALTLRIDTTAPVITPNPAFTGDIPAGSVPAQPTCQASDAVSGIADCTVTGYGTGVGEHQLITTARDKAGNVSQTTASYRVVEQAGLDVAVTASSRCISGKVILTVVVVNRDDVPVTATVTTPYGAKTITALAPGKTSSQAFTTRLVTMPAGTATTVADATINGKKVTTQISTPYTARSC